MAKDVAWHCPYGCGKTKPTADSLEKHMGDHHRKAMQQTIDEGAERAAAKRKRSKRGPKPKPAQAKTARALEEHAAAFNNASTAVKQK